MLIAGIEGVSLMSKDIELSDPKFAAFWKNYPRKTGKKEARKAWVKLCVTDALLDKMLTALAWQSQQPQWVKDGGSFIPHPATWLRAERWDDEPFEPLVPYESPLTRQLRQSSQEFLNRARPKSLRSNVQ